MDKKESREHVHALLDRLSIDDEPVTDEEVEAVLRSEAWFEKNGGKGIPMEEVLVEMGLNDGRLWAWGFERCVPELT